MCSVEILIKLQGQVHSSNNIVIFVAFLGQYKLTKYSERISSVLRAPEHNPWGFTRIFWIWWFIHLCLSPCYARQRRLVLIWIANFCKFVKCLEIPQIFLETGNCVEISRKFSNNKHYFNLSLRILFYYKLIY